MGSDQQDILLLQMIELVLSSEMGVLRVAENLIIKKDRLRPGKMLLVDLEKGKIVQDNDLKKQMYDKLNYSKIVKENIVTLKGRSFIKKFSIRKR